MSQLPELIPALGVATGVAEESASDSSHRYLS